MTFLDFPKYLAAGVSGFLRPRRKRRFSQRSNRLIPAYATTPVLRFEVLRIPNLDRKSEAETLLKLASSVAAVQLSTKALSEQIIAVGVKPFDLN